MILVDSRKGDVMAERFFILKKNPAPTTARACIDWLTCRAAALLATAYSSGRSDRKWICPLCQKIVPKGAYEYGSDTISPGAVHLMAYHRQLVTDDDQRWLISLTYISGQAPSSELLGL